MGDSNVKCKFIEIRSSKELMIGARELYSVQQLFDVSIPCRQVNSSDSESN